MNDLLDHEPQKLLGKIRIKMSVIGERPKAIDLLFLALKIGWREAVRSLQLANFLGALEPFRQQIDQSRINVINAGAQPH
jgi:hypothetical protein